MLKKFFSVFGVMLLVCFSFYYTDLATNLIKNNDPIMKEIIKVSKEYDENPINAVLIDNNIIPGISGSKINTDESYFSMKKYGSFNENLMVCEEVLPSGSVSNTFDKYFSSGNKSKRDVCLVIVVEDYSYLENIIDILNSKGVKATFFVDSEIIDDSIDVLKLINNSNHEVEVKLDYYTKEEILKYNTVFKTTIDKKMNFCYTTKENRTILDNCNVSKLHTVLPNLVTSNFPYSDVKNNLDNGSIINLNNNQHTLRELKYIINYINQKGFDLVTLNEIIVE